MKKNPQRRPHLISWSAPWRGRQYIWPWFILSHHPCLTLYVSTNTTKDVSTNTTKNVQQIQQIYQKVLHIIKLYQEILISWSALWGEDGIYMTLIYSIPPPMSHIAYITNKNTIITRSDKNNNSMNFSCVWEQNKNKNNTFKKIYKKLYLV